jgi:uncharacterized protein (TIGR02391 family)
VNIEARVDKRLWGAIKNSYEVRNYSSAILDAIIFLSNLIREKTGLESDGVALAGQALGGANPPLKVNKLQTESEQNVQKGLEQLLRGIYQGIRNPRSHERISDSSDDADAIIIFINYLLHIIDQSKSVFTISDTLKRLFDPYFVKGARYAKLLAAEIPPRHRLEVYVEAYRKKHTGDGDKLSHSFAALFSDLTDHDKQQVYDLVSDDMMNAETDEDIRLIIRTQPPANWIHYKETARLRIENKLIESIGTGRYSIEEEKCLSGSIGTCAQDIARYFLLKSEYIEAVAHCLHSSADRECSDYVFKYLFSNLYLVDVVPSGYLALLIKAGLNNGDTRFKVAMDRVGPFLDADSPGRQWVSRFQKEIDAFVAGKKRVPPAGSGGFDEMDDDIPF